MAPEAPPAGLPISSVSLMLGIPVPTIRSWERRYGLAVSTRTGGRHRRYDIRDIERLRAMRDAITAGRRAQEAARTVAAATEDAAGRRDHVREILDSALRFDADGVREHLRYAVIELGTERAIQVVVLPALREIGSLWEAGRCDVANEHLASQEVRSWLGAQAGSGPGSRRPPIVLACGPQDLHTIGLEAFFVLLSRRGWRCRVLGALTPAGSLVAAVRACGACAVVVSSHMNINRRAAVESLRAVAELPGVARFYAGNAFASAASRAGVPGVYLGDDLPAAAETVERALLLPPGREEVPSPP